MERVDEFEEPEQPLVELALELTGEAIDETAEALEPGDEAAEW